MKADDKQFVMNDCRAKKGSIISLKSLLQNSLQRCKQSVIYVFERSRKHHDPSNFKLRGDNALTAYVFILHEKMVKPNKKFEEECKITCEDFKGDI
jgi:hypothetical protein